MRPSHQGHNQTQTLDNYTRKLPRITLEEGEITRLCVALRAAEDLRRFGRVPNGECEEAILREGQRAEARMVQANLRLVVRFARRYRSAGLPFDDLIQAGNVGLIEAARRFDNRKGFRFSTYAHYWITASIGETVRISRNLVRLPRDLDAELGRHRRGEVALDQGRIRLLESLVNVRSLDDGSAEGGRLHDPIAADQPDNDALGLVLLRDLEFALAILDTRSRELLILRYGLDGQRPLKVMELAQRYGLTRERVRQIHNSALQKLREDAAVSGMRCWLT